MSKHTPGPWELDVENEEDAVRRFVVNARQFTIGEWQIADMIDGDDETRRANARLIAAAPDMLDELKSILEVLENQGLAPKRQETIRQVIEKATLE